MLRRHIAAPRGYKKHGRFYLPSILTQAPTGGGGGTGWGSVAVGDYVEGGVYAGIITYADARQFHIIFGLAESQGASLPWKTSLTDTPNTGDSDDGVSNTQAMETAGLSSHPAAQYCVDYSNDGFDDFYLGSLNEIVFCDTQLAGHAELADLESSGDWLWTSTQINGGEAWIRRFSPDTNFEQAKTTVGGVAFRPIRRVPV